MSFGFFTELLKFIEVRGNSFMHSQGKKADALDCFPSPFPTSQKESENYIN